MGDTFAKLAAEPQRAANEGGARDLVTARRFAGFATLALGLLALTAGPAAARDWYVTPGGAGSACTQVTPCSLAVGAGDAAGDDTVHVDGDSGDYLDIDTDILVDAHAAVVGEGAQMPRIVFSTGWIVTGSGTSLTRLALSRSGGSPKAVLGLFGGTGSRLLLESATGFPVEMSRSLLRDSVVRQTGESLPAIHAVNDNILRNVTAIATGAGSTGISFLGSERFPPPPDCESTGILNMQNTIARGVEWDLSSTGTAKCPAPIDAGHSSYRAGKVLLSGPGASVNDLGGNQTSVEPLLAADGFRQLPGSPTIDAGALTPENGPTDFDGEPRTQGSAPDIGADETLLPPAPLPVADTTLPVADTTTPVGSKLRFAPRRFRPGRAGTAGVSRSGRKKGKRGTPPPTSRMSYRLSEAATARFVIQRRAIGRRLGRRCLIGKRARQLRDRKRCRRFVRRGAFSHAGVAGVNRLRFSGRIGRKSLRPGVYRMVGIPTDAAGNRGRRFNAVFAIARR